MKLADLIGPDRIVLGLKTRDKAQALAEIARRAAATMPTGAGAILAEPILAALTAREQLGSTGFGRGFALPHVRLAGLDRLFCMLVRLVKPIEYDAIDRQPVDVVVLMLIPLDKGNEHVAALAAVARAMRDDGVLREIRKAGSATALFEQLAASGF